MLAEVFADFLKRWFLLAIPNDCDDTDVQARANTEVMLSEKLSL